MQDCVSNATVPGTILTSLIRNGSFGDFGRPETSNEDLTDYVLRDELLGTIPDINTTGSAFYTFWYQTDVNLTAIFDSQCYDRKESSNNTSLSHFLLEFHGVNYNLSQGLFVNGVRQSELTSTPTPAAGMFRRRLFEVKVNGSMMSIAFLVSPPDHSGYVGAGGQGGDHSLAMDGAIMQSAAGWDWITSVPDRNTGPWDKITLTPLSSSSLHDTSSEVGSSKEKIQAAAAAAANDRRSEYKQEKDFSLFLRNGFVDTLHLDFGSKQDMNVSNRIKHPHKAIMRASIEVVKLTSIHQGDMKSLTAKKQHLIHLSILNSKKEKVFSHSEELIFSFLDDTSEYERQQQEQLDENVMSTLVEVDFELSSDRLQLWWPHTMLLSDHDVLTEDRLNMPEVLPHLYTAQFSLLSIQEEQHGQDQAGQEHIEYIFGAEEGEDLSNYLKLYDYSLHFGVRTVEKYYNNKTEGVAFKVNGCDIYLEGGNWITTDIFLRYANQKDRYESEVLLHRAMGMNLIRVWGGGITERRGFYEACDKYGILVFQEFWMTGDNNGRWAGSYDWPLNHEDYIENARDVVLQIRHHPCLLLIGGGNELSPIELNPPSDIASSLYDIMEEFAPTIPFILSSMSPQNTSEPFDSTYALSPNDGNYGGNLLSKFYNDRNPGLSEYSEIPISFQPEIGSISSPGVWSLARFLNQSALDSFPPVGANSNDIHPSWKFHKYEAFTTTNTDDSSVYDFVYAYGDHKTVTDWSIAATMVQHQQYQALFEGFASHSFEWYSAVIMWKSCSPWPALRGNLYDSYLAANGGFYGVQQATSNNVQLPSSSSSSSSASMKIWDIWMKSLHVQINPSTFTCGVMNRAQVDFDVSAVNSTLQVNITYRNLSGALVGEASQVRFLSSSLLKSSAFTPCSGDPFELPLSNNQDKLGQSSDDQSILVEVELWAQVLSEKNKIALSTGSKLLSLSTSEESLPFQKDVLKEAAAAESETKLIARNSYWVAVGSDGVNSTKVMKKDKISKKGKDRERKESEKNPQNTSNSEHSDPEFHHHLSPSSLDSLLSTNSYIVSAPIYEDIAALRFDQNNWVMLTGNGSIRNVVGEDGEDFLDITLNISHANQGIGDKGTFPNVVAFYVMLTLTYLPTSSPPLWKSSSKLLEEQQYQDDTRILPVFWSENHFWLLPGELKTIKAKVFSRHDLSKKEKKVTEGNQGEGEKFVVDITGWNVASGFIELSEVD